MSPEQKREVRRLYIEGRMREAAIAERLGVPLKDVQNFVNYGDGPVEREPRVPRAKPGAVSSETIDRLDTIVSGLNLTHPRRHRPPSEETKAKIAESVRATLAEKRSRAVPSNHGPYSVTAEPEGIAR